jgi:hypothetical protein
MAEKHQLVIGQLSDWGNRTFRAKSGALILKTHIDQELAQSLIARKLPNGRALLQAALRAATARFCTESTITPIRPDGVSRDVALLHEPVLEEGV